MADKQFYDISMWQAALLLGWYYLSGKARSDRLIARADKEFEEEYPILCGKPILRPFHYKDESDRAYKNMLKWLEEEKIFIFGVVVDWEDPTRSVEHIALNKYFIKNQPEAVAQDLENWAGRIRKGVVEI